MDSRKGDAVTLGTLTPAQPASIEPKPTGPDSGVGCIGLDPKRGAVAEGLVKRTSLRTLSEHDLQAQNLKPFIVKTAPACEFLDVKASLRVGSGGLTERSVRRPWFCADEYRPIASGGETGSLGGRRHCRGKLVTVTVVFNNY